MNRSHVITVTEATGRDRTLEPLRLGLPLPLGACREVDELALHDENGHFIPSLKTVMARWQDQSIKWCLLQFHLSLDCGQSLRIFLSLSDQSQAPQIDAPRIPPANNIATCRAGFSFDNSRTTLFDSIHFDGQPQCSAARLRFEFADGYVADAECDSVESRIDQTQGATAITTVKQRGAVNSASGAEILRVQLDWTFYHATDTAGCRVTIHNPAAAEHGNGLWDLGDPGSVLIRSVRFEIDLQQSPHSVMLQTQTGTAWQTARSKQVSLYQESSGGDNWDSPTHVNRENRVPMRLKGYRLQLDSEESSGDRASPVISLQTADGCFLNVRLRHFWQNFPKELAFEGKTLSIELFPEAFPDRHELQAGEKKTHELVFSMTQAADELHWVENPLQLQYAVDWLRSSKALPDLDRDDPDAEISKIIQQGIDGRSNFFAKREAVDEYGWRHFGDLYADHETLGYDGDDIFVSHYNNQYDPLNGFLQQFLASGDARWFELADDLARHISDIDLYDTEQDRDEYNFGFFWHTDHYVPAATATHRTYSINQPKNVYQDHAGGGGPGGQHCYSSGLALHYLLTGYEPSKRAVEHLAHWITVYYEGNNTLAETLLAIKNRHRRDLKDVFTGQYPLDRGTGNYINTLLDLHSLDGDSAALERCGRIIRETASPRDDIARRELENVEATWFYTVFLQAVARFLHIKRSAGQLDSDFAFGRQLLLHYTDWMLLHEYPYLEKPEVLEYPNTTWAAQDIRKACLFAHAACLDAGRADAYRSKAAFFRQYVANSLRDDPTASYTRILSILMQNRIPGISIDDALPDVNNEFTAIADPSAREYSLIRRIWSAAIGIKPCAELQWAGKRFAGLRNLSERCKRS